MKTLHGILWAIHWFYFLTKGNNGYFRQIIVLIPFKLLQIKWWMWNVSRAKLHSFSFDSLFLSYNGQLSYKLFEVYNCTQISTFDRVIFSISPKKSKLNKFVVKSKKLHSKTDKHNDSFNFLLFVCTCVFLVVYLKIHKMQSTEPERHFCKPIVIALCIRNQQLCVCVCCWPFLSSHPNCYHFG